MPAIARDDLHRVAELSGLKVAGITDVSPIAEAGKRLVEWQNSGYAGQMQYMLRESNLFCDPIRLLKEARSVISFSVYYSRKPHPELLAGSGRVARYAWGRDYHRALPRRMKKLCSNLRDLVGEGLDARYFTDAVPLLERAFAERGGAGFVGKNTMLIRRGGGSYFLLAELVSNLEVEDAPAPFSIVGSCGTCARCITGCPTGALVDEFVLDSRKCISYLTIERRDAFLEEERRALGEWVFGCDVCQEVCPFNHRSLKYSEPAEFEEFEARQGSGPLLELGEVLGIRTREEYLRRFAGTPLMRPGREGLLRNAACVAANTMAENLLPALVSALVEDPAPLVRQHALWAIAEMKCRGLAVSEYDRLLALARQDCAPEVVAEANNKAIA